MCIFKKKKNIEPVVIPPEDKFKKTVNAFTIVMCKKLYRKEIAPEDVEFLNTEFADFYNVFNALKQHQENLIQKYMYMLYAHDKTLQEAKADIELKIQNLKAKLIRYAATNNPSPTIIKQIQGWLANRQEELAIINAAEKTDTPEILGEPIPEVETALATKKRGRKAGTKKSSKAGIKKAKAKKAAPEEEPEEEGEHE